MSQLLFKYSVVEIVSRISNKIYVLLLSYYLSIDLFGVVSMLLVFELVVPQFMSLGHDRVIIRFVGNGQYSDDDLLSKAIKNVFYTSLLIFAIIATTNKFLFNLDFLFLLLFMLSVVALGLSVVLQNYYRAVQDHIKFYAIRAGIPLLKVLLLIIFMCFNKSIEMYIVSTFLSIVIIFSTLLINVRNSVGRMITYNGDNNNELSSYSRSMLAHTFFQTIPTSGDKFLLNRYVDEYTLGIYSFTQQIGSSVSLMFQGMTTYIEPKIYRSTSEEKDILLSKFLMLAFALVAIYVIFLTHFYESLIVIAMGGKYLDTLPYVINQSLAYATTLGYFSASYLILDKKLASKLMRLSFVYSSIYLLLIVVANMLLIVNIQIIIDVFILSNLSLVFIANNTVWKIVSDKYKFYLVSYEIFCISVYTIYRIG